MHLAAAAASFLSLTVPAAANRCYWVGRQIYCDAGCRVIDRWWDGRQEWMKWSCSPPPELLMLGGLAAAIVIIAVVLNAVKNAAQSSTSSAIAEVNRETATTDEITRIMEEAMRLGDDHIRRMRDKYRNGD